MRTTAFAFLVVTLCAGAARAQTPDATVEVSNRETYVGVPITLTITIHNTDRYVLPDEIVVEGARVQPTPGRSQQSMTQIINGRMTSTSTYTHEYKIIPIAPGALTVPAMTISVAGKPKHIDPIEIVVNEIGAEPGDEDLLILEIESDRDTFFLGEPAEVTLRIWVKPYHDQRYNVTVSRNDMWRLINKELSAWGEFEGLIKDLNDSPFPGFRDETQIPEGGETLRADAEGVRRSYYFYELKETIWPKQSGELRLDDVQVMMEYPTRLGVRREFIRERLTITDSKLLAAKVEKSPIFIKPTPEEGKPDCFAGAVGQYSLSAQAQPTEVAVGDPITLSLVIRDRTGSSRLDVLQPPPLAATAELMKNFRIPTDPLAGEVMGNSKRFVQTLRAVDEDVTRIPPIQFAYFDPVRERYVTIESEAIPITVKAASSLSMTDIVEAPGGTPPSQAGPTSMTQVSAGVLANYDGVDSLLADQTLTLGWVHASLLAFPPLLVGVIALARRRSERFRTDERFARRRTARKTALRRLARVTSDDPDRQMESLAEALGGYIADRCNLPAGAHTRGDLVARLEDGSLPDQLIEQIDGMLAECEHSRYAGITSQSASDALARTRDLIERLEKEKLS